MVILDNYSSGSKSNHINDKRINYIKGDDLKQFQEAVKPVYDYFINKGMFTMDEIKMAQKIAKNKN